MLIVTFRTYLEIASLYVANFSLRKEPISEIFKYFHYTTVLMNDNSFTVALRNLQTTSTQGLGQWVWFCGRQSQKLDKYYNKKFVELRVLLKV